MRRHLGGGITAAAIRGDICDLFDVGRGRERDEADEVRTWRGRKEGWGAPTGAPRPLVYYNCCILSKMQGLMDTFISNSAYNVKNLYDMRIESQIFTNKAKNYFRAYTRELIR